MILSMNWAHVNADGSDDTEEYDLAVSIHNMPTYLGPRRNVEIRPPIARLACP